MHVVRSVVNHHALLHEPFVNVIERENEHTEEFLTLNQGWLWAGYVSNNQTWTVTILVIGLKPGYLSNNQR